MKPPFKGRGTKKCCFCCDLDPDYTCYLIGSLCLVLFAFGGLIALDFPNPFEIIMNALFFFYYLTAGLCLILGTLYMNQKAKIVYCWMMLFGVILIFFSIISVIFTLSTQQSYFSIDSGTFRGRIVLFTVFSIKYLLLIAFSFYTPFVVLGNLETYRKAPENATGT